MSKDKIFATIELWLGLFCFVSISLLVFAFNNLDYRLENLIISCSIAFAVSSLTVLLFLLYYTEGKFISQFSPEQESLANIPDGLMHFGKLTAADGLSVGYVIIYDDAIQEPHIYQTDFGQRIEFGNGTVEIFPKEKSAAIVHPKDISLAIKYLDQFKISIGFKEFE